MSPSRDTDIEYKSSRAGREALHALARARPSRSLARTVIGVLTLAARPWVATPYAGVNVPPRSRPARALGPSGGFWDGGQESGAFAGRASG